MTTIDPAELRPHSILHHLPAPAKDAPEVLACADAIREHGGHLLPLIIDEQHHLLTDDSRLRWMAAKRMGLAEVPVLVQPGLLAPVISLNALVHRAHYTKSALAYLAVPLLKPALEAARAHRIECLKRGQKPVVVSDDYGTTVEALAGKLGFHRDMLFKAQQVHAEFEKDRKKYTFTIQGGPRDGEEVQQTLREHFEPKILRHQQGDEHEGTRPVGLGGVMKAIGSIRATKGAPKRTDPQLELFTGGFNALAKRFSYWTEFDAAEKAKAAAALDEFLDAMPPDLLEAFQAKARARLKKLRLEEPH